MRKTIAIISVLVLGVVGATAVYLALFTPAQGNTQDTPSEPLISSFYVGINAAKNDATNAALDASGIKQNVQDDLLKHSADIAQATGLSTDQVEAGISSLNIPNWKAITLPSDAVESAVYPLDFQGLEGNIILYDDPSYVTVDSMGQRITLAVPASAEEFLPYLSYL